MKKYLASTLVLILLSSASFAEVQSTDEVTTSSIVKLGSLDVTVEPTEILVKEKQYKVDFGIAQEKNSVSWELKVNKSLSTFEDTNSLSAGISWKF